jgi:hypothetical protein
MRSDSTYPKPADDATATSGVERVSAEIPKWIYGGDVNEFASTCQFKIRRIKGTDFGWHVQTTEAYERRTPNFFKPISIVDHNGQENWDVLTRLPTSGVDSPVTEEMLSAEQDRILASGSPSLVGLMHWIRISVASATEQKLTEAATAAIAGMREVKSEDGQAVFPDVSLTFVQCSPVLPSRMTFARLQLRIEDDPQVLENRPQQNNGEMALGSGWNLQSDMAVFRDAYFAPLALCLSPRIWAVHAPRIQGTLMFNFGRVISGRNKWPAELLQLFGLHSETKPIDVPVVETQNMDAAVSWWSAALDHLFAELSDLGNFANRERQFRGRWQFETVLSIEQIAKRIRSILATHRDSDARRLLAFSALDTFDGLGLVAFDNACQLSRATKALDLLKERLPSAAQPLLLPNAERAVEGLRGCQEGFFHAPRVTAEGVRVPSKGSETILEHATAASRYLRVLRNATHGFSPKDDSERGRDEALLMTHNGDIPDDFALLPYLYWLEMLAAPERLKKILRNRYGRR